MAVLVCVLITAGCSNSATVLGHTPGAIGPVETDSAGMPLPQIAWGDAGQLRIVAFGSSSCPPIPTSVAVDDPHRVIIRTASASDGPCTADIAPTTTTVAAPPGLDDTVDAQARIDGIEVTLAHR